MRFVLPILIFCLWPVSTLTATDEKTPQERLNTALYGVPSGFFYVSSGATESRGNLKLQPGVQLTPLSHSNSTGNIYDVREWLVAMGLSFPQGSEALYFLDRSTLFVRNTKANLELIDAFGHSGGVNFSVLQNEITLVALDQPSANLENPPPTFTKLKESAGSSWKEIFTLRITSKPGQSVQTQALSGQEPVTLPIETLPPNTYWPDTIKAPELASEATGSTCAIGTIVGPDGQTMDSSLSFHYRGLLPGDPSPLNLRFEGSTTLKEGYPQILQLVTPSEDGPAYALVLKVTRILPTTEPVSSVEKPEPSQ